MCDNRGILIIQHFYRGELNYVICVGEVKNSNLFQREVALQVTFSPVKSPRWIQPGNWDIGFNLAQILTTSFCNIVSNVKTAEHANCDPISGNINDPVIKHIAKCRDHQGILKIWEVCDSQLKQILNDTLSLDSADIF